MTGARRLTHLLYVLILAGCAHRTPEQAALDVAEAMFYAAQIVLPLVAW